MNVDYNLIGKRIQSERKRIGYTQELLAEKLGVSVGYVSQVERGITKISLDLLAAISSILNCDIAFLVTGSAIDNDTYISRDIFESISSLDNTKRKMLYDFIELLKKW